MTAPSKTEEKRLIDQARRGEEAALAELVERHLPGIHGLAFALTGSPTESDDLCQEAFLRAFQKLSSYRGEASFRAWVSGIARHAFLETRRATIRQRAIQQRRGERQRAATDRRELERAMDREQAAGRVRELVGDLPEDLRVPLLLHYFEGQSTPRVAERLGLKEATVRKRLERARKALEGRSSSSELEGALSAIVPVFGLSERIVREASASIVSGTLAGAKASAATSLPILAWTLKILLSTALVGGLGAAVWFGTVGGSERAGESKASPSKQSIAEVRSLPVSLSPLSPENRGRASHVAEVGSGEAPDDDGGVGTFSEESSLEVRMVHADSGQAVAGATVALRRWLNDERAWESVASAISDELGRCRFAGLNAGRYAVRSTPTPPRVYFAERIEIGEGTDQTVEVSVEDGAMVTLRIVEKHTSWPIPDVSVSLKREDGPPRYLGQTDSEGRVTPEYPIALGEAQVLCHEGSSSRRLSQLGESASNLDAGHVSIESDTEQLTCEYPWAGEVHGRVLDPEGLPVSGAWMLAQADQSSSTRWPAEGERVEKTDADGRFRLRRLPTDRTLRVLCLATGHAVGVSETVRPTEPHDGSEALIRLRSESRVRGLVRLASGAPIGGATVFVDPVLSTPAPPLVTSNPDGSYELGQLTEGQYFIHASRPGRYRWRSYQYFEIGSEETKDLDLIFDPAREIHGRVVPGEGETLQSVRVSIRGLKPDADGEVFRFGQGVEPDGRFVITGLEPGASYRIVARRSSVEGEPVEALAGAVNVLVPWAGSTELKQIDWTIVDDVTGAPIEEGMLSNQTFVRGHVRSVLAPGQYDFLCYARSHAPLRYDLIVPEGLEEPLEIELRMKPGRTVRGRVVDEQGQPIEHATVTLVVVRKSESSHTWTFPDVLNVYSDENGEFVFDSLPPEGGRLRATLDARFGEVDAEGDFVEIQLR